MPVGTVSQVTPQKSVRSGRTISGDYQIPWVMGKAPGPEIEGFTCVIEGEFLYTGTVANMIAWVVEINSPC